MPTPEELERLAPGGLEEDSPLHRLVVQEAAWRRTFTHRPHNCQFVGGFCADCGCPKKEKAEASQPPPSPSPSDTPV
jgi:hypothetical protein